MLEKKPLVLIVEDDPLIAYDLQEILEKENYNIIIESKSVENAISIIKKDKPDLVLLDVNLNQLKDGIDIGKYLLNFDTIPYIYITAHSDNMTISRINETRPYGYIFKPFKEKDVIININIVLNNFKFRKIDLNREPNNDKINSDQNPYIIKKIIQYIDDNINNDIYLDELYKLTKWDKFHFLRMFKKYAGFTPYQYILKKKIEIGCILLVDTDLSISDIAFDLGFNSHPNFSIRFKSIMGQTPDEYRKINKVKKWSKF